jgi:ribosome-binding protein aMBF1 (putative translation factor)
MPVPKNRDQAFVAEDVPAIGRQAPKRAPGNSPSPAFIVRDSLAKALRQNREGHDLSLRQMSVELHVDAVKLSMMERGALKTWTRQDMEAVMKAFGLLKARPSSARIKTPS